jgi:plastocyanin
MRRTVLALACTSAFAIVPAYAANHDVSVGGAAGFAFTPSTLTITEGDTVTFTNAGGFHNVASDAGAVTSFRCADGCDGDGSGGSGDASGSAWVAVVTFPTAGSAPYHCEVHAGSGMTGTITVEPAAATPTLEDSPGTVEGSAEAGASTVTGFDIANTGGATLDWTLDSSSADCVAPVDVPWIALDPTAGSIVQGGAATSIGVTLDATGLTAGAYSANICVHSNDVAHDPLTLPVNFTVNTPDLIFQNGFDG